MTSLCAGSAASLTRETERILSAHEPAIQLANQEKIDKFKSANRDCADMRFTQNVTECEFQDLAEMRKLIDRHPDKYAANRELLDNGRNG